MRARFPSVSADHISYSFECARSQASDLSQTDALKSAQNRSHNHVQSLQAKAPPSGSEPHEALPGEC